MLPKFPKVVKFQANQNRSFVREKSRELSPFLFLIKPHVVFEGSGSALKRPDEEAEDIKMESVSAEVTFSRCKIEDFDRSFVYSKLEDVAEQLAKGMSEMVHRRLAETTEKVGNLVDGKGQKMSEELMLETLEKMDHSFDAFGVWQPPVMVVGPELFESVSKMQETTTGRRKLEKILTRKRDEFFSREASRVLVG